MRGGRELGRRDGFGPSIAIRRWEAHSPQTLDATFLKALVGSRPPPSFWPPPPSPPSPLLSLPKCCSRPPIVKLFAAALPPIPSSPSVVLPRRISFVWVQVSIGELVGGRKEERKNPRWWTSGSYLGLCPNFPVKESKIVVVITPVD